MKSADNSFDKHRARLASMPEGLLNRLEPSFVGLEREADPNGYSRKRYSKLCERYTQAMKDADFISGSDYEQRYRLYSRTARGFAAEFSQFFDSLREFIGYSACVGGRWGQGDANC
jgi:hypothetical protein